PVPSMDALALRWFDHYVKGKPDPGLASDIAPVTYYEIGSDKWRTAPSWPGPDAHARSWYLAGKSNPGSPGELHQATPTTDGGDAIYPVPVTGLCTRSTSQWTAGLVSGTPCDHNNALNDLAGTSYQTAPMAEPVRLLGPINAELYVSTTAHDGMISAHVEDVAPDGTVTRLTGGWQVLSLRANDRSASMVRDGQILRPWHPFTKASQLPVEPGKVMKVEVEVFPTGAVVKPGHRLRVTLQAFDTPHLLPTLPQLVDSLGGIITVHHSSRYPSRITLPVRG
ncbi:MAG: CocE/NonD family hydrolase, partial [Nocardioidaceae bacterium]